MKTKEYLSKLLEDLNEELASSLDRFETTKNRAKALGAEATDLAKVIEDITNVRDKLPD